MRHAILWLRKSENWSGFILVWTERCCKWSTWCEDAKLVGMEAIHANAMCDPCAVTLLKAYVNVCLHYLWCIVHIRFGMDTMLNIWCLQYFRSIVCARGYFFFHFQERDFLQHISQRIVLPAVSTMGEMLWWAQIAFTCGDTQLAVNCIKSTYDIDIKNTATVVCTEAELLNYTWTKVCNVTLTLGAQHGENENLNTEHCPTYTLLLQPIHLWASGQLTASCIFSGCERVICRH